jgi:hypothetical protein
MSNSEKSFVVSTPFSEVVMSHRDVLRKFKFTPAQSKTFSGLGINSTMSVGKTNIKRKE